MMQYSHSKIEKKWQKFWEENKIFSTNLDDNSKKKFYVLDMFPYPSGNGLHVGHIRGYLATDIIAKIKKMQGFNVFHPMGFDSFGLPTEQYAIRKGKDPYKFTDDNINNFLYQLKTVGFGYDTEKIIKTSDPKFYKWTQWTFIQMFKKGLVEYKDVNVNFCPELNTVLANEEIENRDGKMVSERGSYPVFRIKKKQWLIDITKYGKELLDGLKDIDWPESIKKIQKNWIGLINGFEIYLNFFDNKNKISVFISDLLDLKDVKFVVFAIQNNSLDSLLDLNILKQIKKLRIDLKSKPLMDIEQVDKKPLGLYSNLKLINPLTNEILPIYFAEYIDPDFANGIHFGIPNKEYKDRVFLKFHKISEFQKNKEILNEETKKEIRDNIFNKLKNSIKKTYYFKIKKWVFSRQRYWGEPFPIKFDENGNPKTIEEKLLPLILPKIESSKLKNLSKSEPLSSIKEWVENRYDTNVMPQWAGSCWYFLAYLMKDKNEYLSLNSEKAKKRFNNWMPVDLYIGGQEHASSHLIYSRFWNYFLNKINILNIKEPFKKLRNQGMILAENGKKMSKSKGNVVNPLEFIDSHGADALRLHEKFLGPITDHIPWNEKTIDSMRKWLSRIYVLFVKENFWVDKTCQKTNLFFAKTVKNINENYEKLNFNVAISQLMSFINYCYKNKKIQKKHGEVFLKLLAPIAPHLSEEIWSLLGNKKSIFESKWPTIDEKDLIQNNIKIIVQLNGKVKNVFEIKKDLLKDEIISIAKLEISDFLINKKIKKIIFVKNKIVNFVVI